MKPAQAIRDVVTGWERLDSQLVAQLFADQGTYDDPLKDGRLVGPQAILEADRKSTDEEQLRNGSIRSGRPVPRDTFGMRTASFGVNSLAGSPARGDRPERS